MNQRHLIITLCIAATCAMGNAHATTLTPPRHMTGTLTEQADSTGTADAKGTADGKGAEPSSALLRYVSKQDIRRRDDEVAVARKRQEWEQQRQREAKIDTADLAKMHGNTDLESVVVLGRKFKLTEKERTSLQLAANSSSSGFNLLGLVALGVNQIKKKKAKGGKVLSKKEAKLEKLREKLGE